MSNPQQPELRRSETTPGLAPDSIGGELDAKKRPGSKGETGPVPQANKPGTRSGPVQDKPDLDEFAAKLGITDKAVDAAEEAAAGHQGARPGLHLPRPLVLAAYAVGGAVGVVTAVRKLAARRQEAEVTRLRRLLPL